MANFRRLSALVAIYLGAFASAQSNTTQQGQGSVLSTQQIASLSCQNARDAAAGGTSGANILLSNAMISAGPQDQISVQNIRQAQSSLAQSQLALSRIQTNAISGQQPALQDMQSAMTSFVQAGQAVNAALLSSSQPPPGAAGNASAPVLAAEQIPVITSLGPEMKQLIL
ncbi:MAG: hypothetical protein M1820_002858 [Bogoriella megaspora]|nr:MAG: hypothetical protein M1820_002858 [Bogoriella megaspora]